MKEDVSLFHHGPIVTICPTCNEIGIVRRVGGKCWMCGGWIGFEYPTRMAMRVIPMLVPGRVGSLS